MTNQCDNTHREAFNSRRENHDVLCCRDYDERMLASFARQIQS